MLRLPETVRVPVVIKYVFVCRLLQTVRVPKKIIFPKIDVGLGNCSSATLINSMTTAIRSGTLLPIMSPRTGDPGRGHEQPPPAIVCGKNEDFHAKKILKKFQNSILFRISPAPSRSRPSRGLIAPLFRRGAGICATLRPSSAMGKGRYHNNQDLQTLSYRL